MEEKFKYHSGGVISIDFLKLSKQPTFTELQLELQQASIKPINTDIPIIHHPEAKFPEEVDGGKEPLAYYKDKPIYDMVEYFKICTEIMIETISAHIIRTPGKPDVILDKPKGNDK